MITLNQLAEYFEEGLNKTLNNPEIQFRVWAHAGVHNKPERDGNTVTHFITGNLRTSTSSNDATALVMGVNGLSLEFAIQTQAPKTNATQTESELQKIQDGQYPYVAYITGAINKYFLNSQVAQLTDSDGAQFSLSWVAGTAVTGDVAIRSHIGESILFTVYIELTFVKGGISSKSVLTYIDDMTIPYKAVRHGRSTLVERDVYASNLNSKSVATSGAFSVDVEFPANSDAATKACFDFLLNGNLNVAHFVNVQFGNTYEKLYLMTLNSVQTAAQGISILGITASFMEVVDNSLALNVPDSYQVGKFTLSSSNITSITFTPSVDCLAYIAGQALKLTGGQAQTIAIELSSMQYNDDDGVYEVYLITDRAVTLSGTSTQFVTI